MKTYLHLALAALLLAAGCKKDEPPKAVLPPATHEGKNVGGCLIDGEVWLTSFSQGTVISGPGTAAVVSKKKGQYVYDFSINLYSGQSGRSIELKCFNASGTGRCEFTMARPPVPQPDPNYGLYHNGAAPGQVGDFVTGPDATGWLAITYLDAQKYIVAGEFAFTGLDAATGRKVVVSQGRFDTTCFYLEVP